MTRLLFAIAIFTVFHLLPSTPLRGWLIGAVGRRAFMALFSAASIALLIWVYFVYKATPPETVFWVTDTPLRLFTAAMMLFAALLLVLAVTEKRPVLLTGEEILAKADSVRGVLRITRHPVLWAMGIWGLLHMLNNADPPGWVFFGYISALALGGTLIIDLRRKRLLGARWTQITKETSNIPFFAVLAGRNRLVLSEFAPWRVVAAAVLWALVLVGHEYLFGLPVFYF